VLDISAYVHVCNYITGPRETYYALIAVGSKERCDVDVIAHGGNVRPSSGKHEPMAVIASGRRLQPISGCDREANMDRRHRQSYCLG